MYIKGNAFEIGGRAFLNDIDKYDTIPKYIDATIERAKKPGNEILEFPTRIFVVKLGQKKHTVVCDGDIISEEDLQNLKKDLEKYPKKALRIKGALVEIDIDCFEHELVIELAEPNI